MGSPFLLPSRTVVAEILPTLGGRSPLFSFSHVSGALKSDGRTRSYGVTDCVYSS